MFGRGPTTRVAVVSVSELSLCPGRTAVEQLAPVYACVMGVCLQLTAYAAWWSYMKSVAIHRELQARPARWCASWGRPKLADRAAEWGSMSSCSSSAALAIKTPCTHRCWRGKEKYIRQRVCAAAFGRNSCLGYRSSSSSSVCCVRLSVRALLSSDDRSAKESTVDPSKSRRSIPAKADHRSQQELMVDPNKQLRSCRHHSSVLKVQFSSRPGQRRQSSYKLGHPPDEGALWINQNLRSLV
jgi:hypothetical protein